MKNKTIQIAGILLVFAALFISSSHAQVSGSNADVPRIMSYQGQVMTTDGKAMNGTHHITASLYSDSYGKNSVWQGSYDALVTNGIFNILLGSGGTPLPDITAMNRPLWVGISVDRGEEMRPLSQLSSSPYSLNIPDKSVTEAKLAPDLQSAIFGKGNTPTVQNANSAVYWSETGNNSTTAGTNYVGTSDSVALEIHVNHGDATANRGSKRVMRYEPNSSSPNIIGGFQGNLITRSTGSIIDGGGSNGQINEIRSSYSVISGGRNNLIDSNSSNSVIIAGGGNTIARGAINSYVGAGTTGSINDGAQYSAILGGSTNHIDDSCKNGFIGGGGNNTIGSKGTYGTITGGDHLTGQSYAQTVMGHYNSAQGTSKPTSINGDDRLLIVGNGTDADHKSNAFEVSDNGHSIVYHTNDSGITHPAITGATYKDNIIYAWGYWKVTDARTFFSTSSFGCEIIRSSTGMLTVTLNLVKPDGTGTCLNDKDAAIVVTPNNTGNNNPPSCVIAAVENLTNNSNTSTTFTIHTTTQSVQPANPPTHGDYWLSCDDVDSGLMFIVTGRPH